MSQMSSERGLWLLNRRMSYQMASFHIIIAGWWWIDAETSSKEFNCQMSSIFGVVHNSIKNVIITEVRFHTDYQDCQSWILWHHCRLGIWFYLHLILYYIRVIVYYFKNIPWFSHLGVLSKLQIRLAHDRSSSSITNSLFRYLPKSTI